MTATSTSAPATIWCAACGHRQEEDYRPPTIEEATGQIQRDYDKDRALTRLNHALGPQIGYA